MRLPEFMKPALLKVDPRLELVVTDVLNAVSSPRYPKHQGGAKHQMGV